MAKTVFITGTSSGIGREAVKVFSKNGWNVVATMRSPEKEKELNNLENVLVTRLDVEDPDSIQDAVNRGMESYGHLDALVNSAGYGLMGVFESSTSEQIRKQYDVNVFGLMDVTRAVLPYLRKNETGVIINLSSFGGVVALPFGSPYNSTKFAVEGFSEALWHELSPLNISVKIIEPGSIATNFRGSAELIKNDIPEYGPLFNAFFQQYPGVTGDLKKATAEDVANMIYTAATDGTSQLRYVAGSDAQFFIDLKTKNSDSTYLGMIREKFFNQ